MISHEVFNRMIQEAVKVVQNRMITKLLSTGYGYTTLCTEQYDPACSCKAIMNCAKLGDASTAIMLMTQVQESAALAKRNNRRNKIGEGSNRFWQCAPDALHRL